MPDFPINPIRMDGYLQSLSASAIRDLMSAADSEGKFIQFLPGDFVPVTPAASSATGSAASGVPSKDVDPNAQGSAVPPEAAVSVSGTATQPAVSYSFVDRYVPGDEVPADMWMPYSPAQNLTAQNPAAGTAAAVLQAYAAAQGHLPPATDQPGAKNANPAESSASQGTENVIPAESTASQPKSADTGLIENAADLVETTALFHQETPLSAFDGRISDHAVQPQAEPDTQAAPAAEEIIEGKKVVSLPSAIDADTFFLPLKTMIHSMAEVRNTQILQFSRGDAVPLLEFDAPHAQQVLGRLLSSAVGFSTGHITLITDAQAAEDAAVQLRFVIQAQMDLPASVISYLNKTGALPLGPPLENLALNLVLCRQLASLMQGNLAIRSDLDGNTLFYLDLHARRGGTNGKRSATEIGRFSGRRILLAMPESPDLHRLAELLHKREMLPDAARTPEDATRRFVKSRPGYYDAVISSFGGELLQQLRQARRTDAPRIPILALLADPSPAALSSAFEGGCSACLPVSFTGSQLFDTLGILLL